MAPLDTCGKFVNRGIIRRSNPIKAKNKCSTVGLAIGRDQRPRRRDSQPHSPAAPINLSNPHLPHDDNDFKLPINKLGYSVTAGSVKATLP